MPKTAQPRTCKYCDRPAKKNLVNGRNKGWLRTCGSPERLTQQYRSAQVTAKKRTTQSRVCPLCQKPYTATNGRQRWCRTCVPDQKWRHIARRYSLGRPQWNALLKKQHGHCALCDNAPSVVDHDHETGHVRGLLCYSCNLLVAGLETRDGWLQRAKKYVGGRRAFS